MLDCDLLKSFTVREHVNDDTLGKHLVDEGIETGEYVMKNYEYFNLLNDIWFVLAVSDTISGTDETIRNLYSGVYSGLMYIAFDKYDTENFFHFPTPYE
jgi:hypothetical protein